MQGWADGPTMVISNCNRAVRVQLLCCDNTTADNLLVIHVNVPRHISKAPSTRNSDLNLDQPIQMQSLTGLGASRYLAAAMHSCYTQHNNIHDQRQLIMSPTMWTAAPATVISNLITRTCLRSELTLRLPASNPLLLLLLCLT
jgi:hypothetical protein